LAHTITAEVIHRAEAAVETGGFVARMNAPDVRFAAIVGAPISVVAIAGITANANSVEAAITKGAEVAIVASAAIICRK